MTSVDETTQQVIRKARRQQRQLTPLEQWAWSPVIVLRIALVIVYLLYVYGSVIAFLAGIPIFTLLTPEGYTSVWAALMMPAALVAAVGSLAERWEQRIEKWAALVLTALMSAYVIGVNAVGFASGDLDRQFVGVIALIAIVLPATRFVYLASQSGKARHGRDSS